MWQRRATVVRKPPSFLEAFLSSAGVGITQGMERYFREKERKRGMTQNVMEMVLSGRMPPEVAGTDMFQKYTDVAGISDKPEIKDLKYEALEKYRPPAEKKELPGGTVVTVPREISPELMKAGLPFESYLEQKKKELEQDEDAAWMKGLERKKKEYKIMGEFKNEFAAKVALNGMIKAEVTAKREGQTIEDIKANLQTGAVTVDYLTNVEKTEKKERRATDALKIYKTDRKAYDSNAKTARLRRTKLVTDLAKIKSGVSTTAELDDIVKGILGSLPTKSTDPKVIFDVLYREANKEIDEYNKREKEHAKRLRLKPDQRAKLKRISPKLEDAEPREALNPKDARHAVNPPPRKPEPTDEEINTEAQKLVNSGALDPETNQPYTEEKAREIALKFLKSI
jgi:hypothetical protein